MNTSSVDKVKLLHVVKEAITTSTKNEVTVSPVKLGSLFQTSHTVIEQYLNQFVDEGHIIRVTNENHYPKGIYRLPERRI